MAAAALAISLVALTRPKRRSTLLWVGTPIINIKYWSAAMQEVGWASETLVSTVYTSINRREDYDRLYIGGGNASRINGDLPPKVTTKME